MPRSDPFDPTAVLLPGPRRARATGERATLSAAPRIVLAPATPEAETVRELLCEDLSALGFAPRVDPPAAEDRAGIVLRSRAGGEAPDHPEGYRLTVGVDGIEVVARETAGLYYGTRTLVQWLRAARAGGPSGGEMPVADTLSVPGLHVVDRPDLRVRGFMLDVSRCRVPSLDELFRLVDLLADLKLNQLQLYTEHTFAYRGHEDVWQGASPITPDDVRQLDARCRSRFIELVPNQNSFGHLHRWLIHDRYRPLAEVPEGFAHPFSDAVEPFSLCPTDDRSLELLADLYDQLFPCFASSWFNAGLDETFDLGEGRSAAACGDRGKTTVYLDFLRRVHGLVRDRDHRMLFWGDVVIEAAERTDPVGSIPKEAVALEWGYDAGHPFPERAARYAASGLDFVLCPGTSSWSSLAGRTTNALRNLDEAADTAAETGALGLLITDWGDHGHLQPPAVSAAPLAAGAERAWRAASVGETDPASKDEMKRLARRVDLHVFGNQAGGVAEAALRLGDAHRHLGTRDRNGAAIFFLLAFAHQDLTHERYEGLTTEGLERAEAEIGDALDRLAAADSPRAGLVADELRWVARGLTVACRLGRARLAAGRDRSLSALPTDERKALADRVGALAEEHAPLWLARSRPGGRIESVSRLERTLDLLR